MGDDDYMFDEIPESMSAPLVDTIISPKEGGMTPMNFQWKG